MKFFIDTADVKEVREAAAMGLVDGVTTNQVLLEICDVVKGLGLAKFLQDRENVPT